MNDLSSHLSRFQLIETIRTFFKNDGFIDVITPPAVENPGMETHIHPFQLKSLKDRKDLPLFLHSSPEFCMKELLSLGMEKIFTISYSFRDEPNSPIHRPQFLMLEWYRANERYEKIMEDCQNLINYCLQKFPANVNSGLIVKKTIQEIFQETIKVDILEYLTKEKIIALIREKFPEVPLPQDTLDLGWDDCFFLLFLNKVEPLLDTETPLLIYEYPSLLSAYSTLKKEDPRVCERFEIYWRNMELCNCFNELTDPVEQRKRLNEQGNLKKNLYGYSLPYPKKFQSAMDKGLPSSCGIALGVERLLSALTGSENPFWD
jgi:elongation factor P--(R)-beta-lysine ligase